MTGSDGSVTMYEFRSAVVFYGGVSLAIYENGVARAFYDAVKRRGVFGPLLDALDTRFVVDVISGTSAGGINGLMLAATLESRYDFGDTAELWRTAGGIERLLRPADGGRAESLLDGEGYYYAELRKVFNAICEQRTLDDESPKEIDVFVTGTDMSGQRWSFVDGLKSEVETRRHNLVFHLKHRRGRKWLGVVPSAIGPRSAKDEASLQADVLASVARITSSFPGAFRPFTTGDLTWQRQTHSAPEVLEGAEGILDQSLEALSSSRLRGSDAETAHPLVDGGVLDNKPFGPVLRSIFHRMPGPSGELVRRTVFFVEPDPEKAMRRTRAPAPIQVAVQSALTLPSHDSIVGDLQNVVAHNERVKRTLARRKRAADRNEPASGFYLEALAETVACYAVGVDPAEDDGPGVFPQAAQAVFDWAMERAAGLPKVQAERDPEAKKRLTLEAATDLTRRLDLGFPLRRLAHVLYTHRTLGPRDRAAIGRALKAFKLLRQTWLVHAYASQTRPVTEDVPKDELPDDALARLDAYVRGLWYPGQRPQVTAPVAEWFMDALATETLDELARSARAWLEDRTLPPTPGRALEPIDLVGQALDQLLEADALRTWQEFPLRDAAVYPIEYAARIYELDELDVIRISPYDAGPISGDAKTAGDTLGHFSAFLRKDWRTNDIAWGHSDGLDRIVHALLELDTGGWTHFAARLDEAWTESLRRALTSPRGTDSSSSRPELSTAVEEQMDALDAARRALRVAPTQESEQKKFCDAVIALAQVAALEPYVELIPEDAKEQENYWHWHFDPNRRRRSKDNAAAQLAEWKIGCETVPKAIAPTALLEYVGHAGQLLWGMLGRFPAPAHSHVAKAYRVASSVVPPVLRTVRFVGRLWRQGRTAGALGVAAVFAAGLVLAAAGFVLSNVTWTVAGIAMSLFVAWVVAAILDSRYLAVAGVLLVIGTCWFGWARLGGRERAAAGLRSAADYIAGPGPVSTDP
jgi:predicted acylesterase/phospholipase RssA